MINDRAKLELICKEMEMMLNNRKTIKISDFKRVYWDLRNYLEKDEVETDEEEDECETDEAQEGHGEWSDNMHANCFRCNAHMYYDSKKQKPGQLHFCESCVKISK
jgi:ABC-type Zn2+ transport system substrate-binding protein/surface adhesin